MYWFFGLVCCCVLLVSCCVAVVEFECLVLLGIVVLCGCLSLVCVLVGVLYSICFLSCFVFVFLFLVVSAVVVCHLGFECLPFVWGLACFCWRVCLCEFAWVFDFSFCFLLVRCVL